MVTREELWTLKGFDKKPRKRISVRPVQVTPEMSDADEGLATALRGRLARIQQRTTGIQRMLATQRGEDDPAKTSGLLLQQKKTQLDTFVLEYETIGNELYDAEKDPEMHKEDLETSDIFQTIVDSITCDWEYLSSVKSIYDSVMSTAQHVKRLETSLEENPTSDQSKAVKIVTAKMDELELQLQASPMGEREELTERANELLQRAVTIQTRTSGEKTSDDKPTMYPSKSKDDWKVKELAIPKFDGKIEQWISFWGEFELAINSKKDMKDSVKLVYLKQTINNSGLKSDIADLGIGDKAYPKALKLLHDRYNKPRLLHRQYCEELRSINTQNDTRDSINKLASKLSHLSNGFERLEMMGVSEILTSMGELAMSAEMRHAWYTHTTRRTTTPASEDLIQFLRERADQAEAENQVSSSNHQSERPRGNRQQRQKVRVSSAAPAVPSAPQEVAPPVAVLSAPIQRRESQPGGQKEYPPCRYNCPLCEVKHYAFHCDTFRAFSPTKRRQHAQTHSLCFNCLKPGHGPDTCRSTYKCKTCKGNHNSLLHIDQTGTPNNSVISTNSASSGKTSSIKPSLSMTAQVLVTGENGLTISVRALLDPGAHLCMMHPKVRQALALPRSGDTVCVDTAGPQDVKGPWPLYNVTISSNYKKDWSMEVAVAVTTRVTANLPPQQAPPVEELPHLHGIQLADEQFNMPGTIDLLLGADTMDDVLLKGMITGPKGTPLAQHTTFGWAILGKFPAPLPVSAAITVAQFSPVTKNDRAGDDLLARFFLMEEPPRQKDLFTAEEERVEQHFKDTHKFIKEEGRYQVKLPKVPGDMQLGESRAQAIHRARANEKSLLRKDKYSEAQAVMSKYLELGHARLVNQADLLLPPSACYYMPVHTVYKLSSTSTKVRAVFDASAQTTTNISLNDLLAVGPTIQSSLDQILLRFRTYPVALSGDISMMYREILLHPDDRSMHRYIWREQPTEPWRDYEMLRVTFGVTSSPYLAVKTLQQAAKDFGSDYPEASYHIQHSFYVDDFFGGAETPEDAIKLRKDISHVLSQAGFTIKKWRSNSAQVLDTIPEELRESLPDQDLIDQHSACYPKALGLGWDTRQDGMATHVEVQENYSSTKRGVVSDIARTFDVLGWLSPVILQMKLLYRELWIEKLDWDKEVPENLKQLHRHWRMELPLLSNISLPRHYYDGRCPKKITLQGFCDASKEAFAAVIYSRATYSSGPPTSALVNSKTRVAPLEGRSITELELCGAHLLARLLITTSQALNISVEDIRAYCDNTSVLAWLDGHPKRQKTYVANRICKTNKLLPPATWGYVPTAQNPADCASRGIAAQELLDHHLWWQGPSWLLKEPLQPPKQPNLKEIIKEEVELVVCKLSVVVPDTTLESRSLSFTTVVKITCWVRRIIRKANKQANPPDLQLSVAEQLEAEVFLYRRSQLRSYPEELHHLTADPPTPLASKCRLLALHPQLNRKGLLCVGGRLSNSMLPEEQKHPVILSASDILTSLMFNQYHKQLGHGGPTLILSHSGNLFHIIGAKKLVRAICGRCVDCRKAAVKAGPQLMGQLPSSRLNPDFAFSHTGLDYAGPYITKSGRVRKPVKTKTYLAVFVCFHTKAVHLELVRDATTESLVACLTRFCSRRGLPQEIHSDNGPNLIGAKNELHELYAMLDSKETQNIVQSYLSSQRISWKTIPVAAPHMGGLWEAAVKSAKYHLKRAIGRQCLTYDELDTVICEAEACLNSRPLGAMASHPIDGLCPLTPGHFLIGRALKAYPLEKLSFRPTPLQRWAHVQRITQSFWKRWSQEYLQQLQKAVKWHRQEKNYQVGDMVMLTDGNVFKQQWTMGKVVAVYPGKDGVVRATDVQLEVAVTPTHYESNQELAQTISTRTSVLRRPVHKLAMVLSVDEVPESSIMDAPTAELLQK